MLSTICIAGGGLAGAVLADKAVQRGLKVTWIRPEGLPSASDAAYGMLNPVHIRNATLSWRAAEFYPEASRYFLQASSAAAVSFARAAEVLHWLSGPDEAVFWRQQAESGNLPGYATGDAEHPGFPVLFRPPDGFTRILRTVFVDIPAYLEHIHQKLRDAVTLLTGPFRHGEAELLPDGVRYAGRQYDQVVFCEGIYALQNPWFSALPFRPCKGDVLTIRIDGPDLPVIIHRKVFLIPLGEGMYRAGATYNWADTRFEPTESGREEILESVRQLVRAPVTVTGHKAGVRPAMADRRPVVGVHPQHPRLAILNGLGSRGLIQVPVLADRLLDLLLTGSELPSEINVQRFKKRLA